LRWPSGRPSALRSPSLSSDKTSISIACSRNAASYWGRPRFRNQSPISTLGPVQAGTIIVQRKTECPEDALEWPLRVELRKTVASGTRLLFHQERTYLAQTTTVDERQEETLDLVGMTWSAAAYRQRPWLLAGHVRRADRRRLIQQLP